MNKYGLERGGPAQTFRINTPSSIHAFSAPSIHNSDQSEAEEDIEMGLMLHDQERERQRQQAAAMGRAALGDIQQSPEATTVAATASSSSGQQAALPSQAASASSSSNPTLNPFLGLSETEKYQFMMQMILAAQLMQQAQPSLAIQ